MITRYQQQMLDEGANSVSFVIDALATGNALRAALGAHMAQAYFGAIKDVAGPVGELARELKHALQNVYINRHAV